MVKTEKNNIQTPVEAVSPESSPSPADMPLPDDLTLLRAKLNEYENDLQRLAAEFDNYKKRVDKEKVAARLQGRAEALAPFLDMGDVFTKALQHSNGKNTDAKAMHDGLVLLQRQLHSIFASSGVKEIACTGFPHHAYHDVMLQVPGGKSGEIAQVLRKGYVMGEYVLRPAQVSVYAGAKKEEGNKEANEEEKEEMNAKTDGSENGDEEKETSEPNSE